MPHTGSFIVASLSLHAGRHRSLHFAGLPATRTVRTCARRRCRTSRPACAGAPPVPGRAGRRRSTRSGPRLRVGPHGLPVDVHGGQRLRRHRGLSVRARRRTQAQTSAWTRRSTASSSSRARPRPLSLPRRRWRSTVRCGGRGRTTESAPRLGTDGSRSAVRTNASWYVFGEVAPAEPPLREAQEGAMVLDVAPTGARLSSTLVRSSSEAGPIYAV